MKSDPSVSARDGLSSFHPVVREWFEATLGKPTEAQIGGWPPIVEGRSTLLLAPTGSGKTLAAFLTAIDRLMFGAEPERKQRCRVLYISPLKALAVDVERNLRAPLAGIAATAERRQANYRVPTVAIRSGDTPQGERARLLRTPPDILITTPESLYLLLTSQARESLASVETVIVDEIHSLVATKRGAHLFLSLERLEAHARRQPLQRIGLSATARPADEIARLLGGGIIESATGDSAWRPRPVEIVNASSPKKFDLHVEVAAEDMAKIRGAQPQELKADTSRSPWPSLYPRLVEIIRAHRSTMIFVNSRRLAERMAAALNQTAGEELALAHHGSVAREQRLHMEARLKAGDLPAIVATSSLELGIDMGAVDLVVQIEAPLSVASGMQRLGRAGHQVGAVSRGFIFPRYRGDLPACAAAAARMRAGLVEETFYGRNQLDVLAQQIVAIAALELISVDALFDLARRAAPYADLPRASFEGVLDMLSGRYPSDEFAELRPRLTWDRSAGTVRAREGARRIAVVNAGTIPDRGLYGVFLAGDTTANSRRVGELDEEMVFESRLGEVFLLGASSWRIVEITHDRVLVSPAPGLPGKMPFWHGDRPGRPPEFGRAVGRLCRTLAALPRPQAAQRLIEEHSLNEQAAEDLLDYLHEQKAATGELPCDEVLVVERYQDEMGDWRVCILSPFGARIHAPWATAVQTRLRQERDVEVDTMWSDDGIVFRFTQAPEPPDIEPLLPAPDEVEELIVQGLGAGSLFASHFRENAARALLLPRRHPGKRSPLWAQRRRSADLLQVAARYGSFPIILETYRECLREVFDLPALIDLLRDIAGRKMRVVMVDSHVPSPFAATLLFSYVGNFIYEGDAPLAERRAQSLTLDHAQLKELLGEAELRELLDSDAIAAQEARLQRLNPNARIRHPDALHDLLLELGDLSEAEIALRCEEPHSVDRWLAALQNERRVVAVSIAGQPRYGAVEDAARLRDALGAALPAGLPEVFLEPAANPLIGLAGRYARTHAPFTATAVADRFGLGIAPVTEALRLLAARGQVLEGEFTPDGHGTEWCDTQVLRAIKRQSLARLRHAVEPVPHAALGRFLVEWQGIAGATSGLDALLSVIEVLQGAPIPASALEAEVLPARLRHYRPSDLDTLCAAGEVMWRGLESLGSQDGRIALYLTDRYRELAPPPQPVEDQLALEVRELLATRGASFFDDLAQATGAFGNDVLAALWSLVWAGAVTNDVPTPWRALVDAGRPHQHSARHGHGAGHVPSFRSRRTHLPGSQGRWSLLPAIGGGPPTETQRRAALAAQLLRRHGVLTREAVQAEGIAGGFTAVYEVLKTMEETGRVRRGYFVAGLGATQFALPGADDRLRALKAAPTPSRTLVLAACDPANPYGAALPWPEATGARASRAAGALVVLLDGALAAWIGRAERSLISFLPPREPMRGEAASAIAEALGELVDEGRRRAVLISKIDGASPADSVLRPYLTRAGFTPGTRGYLRRLQPARAGTGEPEQNE